MRLLRLPLLALGLLAACDDDGTGPGDAASGSLRFDYSGSGYEGSFSAAGPLDLDSSGRPEFGSFAFASREGSASGDALLITAFDARQQPRGDVAALVVESVRGTGDYSMDFECESDFGEDCAFGLFVPDVDIQNADLALEPEGEVFFFESGTLRLTRITDRTVEGTFSGTGIFVDLTTGEPSGIVQVTDGRFEVPVLDPDEAGTLDPRGSLAPSLSRMLARPAP